MAGEILFICDNRKFTCFLAYEGQSGSKDRGDPEVVKYFCRHLCLD